MKNISPKKFAFIGLCINLIKLILSVTIFFIFISLFLITNIVELVFSDLNLIILIIITIKISNREIYGKFHKSGKILCIISLIISIIIIIYRIGLFIIMILVNRFLSGDISTGKLLAFNIPTLIIILLEVIQFLWVNYIYKLLRLNSKVSYEEYLKEIRNAGQVSVIVSNENIDQNPPAFFYGDPNKFSESIQQNSGNESIKGI